MQQENITFNDMPQMLAVMYAKLNELGDKVDKLIPPKKSEEQQWFNVADLIVFLPTHLAEQTIYGWTSVKKFYRTPIDLNIGLSNGDCSNGIFSFLVLLPVFSFHLSIKVGL